jgi:hypothetical protein
MEDGSMQKVELGVIDIRHLLNGGRLLADGDIVISVKNLDYSVWLTLIAQAQRDDSIEEGKGELKPVKGR